MFPAMQYTLKLYTHAFPNTPVKVEIECGNFAQEPNFYLFEAVTAGR